MKKNLIITIVVVIVVGVAAFYGGTVFGKTKNTAAPNFNGANFRGVVGQNSNGPARGAMGAGNRGAIGQILSADDKSITISLTSGGSKIIFFSSATKVSKTVEGTTTDLKTGENIIATGTTNSDGSVSATDIQIRPAGIPAIGK